MNNEYDDRVLIKGKDIDTVATTTAEIYEGGLKITFAINRPGAGLDVVKVHWSYEQARRILELIERIKGNG